MIADLQKKSSKYLRKEIFLQRFAYTQTMNIHLTCIKRNEIKHLLKYNNQYNMKVTLIKKMYTFAGAIYCKNYKP